MSLKTDIESTTEKISSPLSPPQLQDQKGYILDAGLVPDHGLKTDKTGRIILIPQPSDDPNDPLNWGPAKKNLVLGVVAASAFLPEFGSALGIITSIPQAREWHIPQNTVLHSLVGNLAMLAFGSVFTVVGMNYFGRLPVLFWFTVFALWTAAFSAGASTFHEFMAARILNGFFSVVTYPATLIYVNDLFFLHEHARKVNAWAFSVLLAPYLGPLITSFMLTKTSWRWVFGLYSILTGLSLIAVVLFSEETYYDKSIPLDEQPKLVSRLSRLVGVEQLKSRRLHNSFGDALMRPIKTLLKPTVFISGVFYLLTYMWAIGINSTLSIFLQPLYHFGPRQIGFFYFAPIVAAILGFLVGHWLHDAVTHLYTRRHAGHLEPEARLLVLWLSTPLMIAGIVLVGFALQRGWHYMLAAFAWGLYVFGLVITTVGINAYNLTAYPEASGEVTALIAFFRSVGGFVDTYVQVDWTRKIGPEKTLGTQAGIVGAAFLLIVVMQIYGKRLRTWSGPLNFSTTE